MQPMFRKESRKGLIDLARTYHCLPVAIVLDLPEKICEERNQSRPDRNFGGYVIRQQASTTEKINKKFEA
jgi:protein phosphatase